MAATIVRCKLSAGQCKTKTPFRFKAFKTLLITKNGMNPSFCL